MNGLYIPNKMGRILLLALEETLGEDDLQTVLARAGLRDLTDYPPADLERAFPLPWVPRLTAAMEDLYGVREGRNLAFRTGQACFRLGAQDLSLFLDALRFTLRLFPPSLRLQTGLEALAEAFNRFTPQSVRVEWTNGTYSWVVENCGFCLGRTATAPCCHLMGGLLQATLEWFASQPVSVTETTCIANGAPHCTLQVEPGV